MSKKRKFIAKNVRKRKMYFSLLFVCIFMIRLGYANLVSNLSINGTLGIWRYDETLYGVLEKAAKRGTYAREYTGDHQDSFVGTGNKRIYHWYASNYANGTAIQNMNNVMFAGHCWQMIRTTDTGGIKMIYNGEVENNQCLDTRGNHVGFNSYGLTNLGSNYYYGTNYEYDATNNLFRLAGVVEQFRYPNDWSSIYGKYTCLKTTDSGTCSTLYMAYLNYDSSYAYCYSIKKSSDYSQFGKIKFFEETKSPGLVGYMSNDLFYSYDETADSITVGGSSWTIDNTYYYSDTIDYGVLNANKYTLVNPILISTLSDYSDLVGKFVLQNSTGTNATYARYVVSVEDNKIYYRLLRYGDMWTSVTIGDSYTEDNGTYTLTNPINITFIDWYNDSSDKNIYKGKYLCLGNNTSCSDIGHICPLQSISNQIYFVTPAFAISFAEGVSYNNNIYTLTGDIKTIWDIYDPVNQEIMKTHHYFCPDSSNSCEDLLYFHEAGTNYLSYMVLTGAPDMETAMNTMLYDENVNVYDSSIKIGIDKWYEHYMTHYSRYLEDTVFCSNRTISEWGGFEADGGLISRDESVLKFAEHNPANDLSCDRVTDQFSTLNPAALLNYKVGLMSASEMNLLNNVNAIATGETYWLISPDQYSFIFADVSEVRYDGLISGSTVYNTRGLRPAISLQPGIKVLSGNGTKASPYVLDAEGDSVSISPSEPVVVRGETISLTANTNVEGTVTWTSSDTNIVTIDQNGVVTGVAVGTATITAQIEDLRSTVVVTVQSSFEHDSLTTVLTNIQNGNTNSYLVGDTKTIDMGSYGTHTLRIANKSIPSACSNSGYSQTACGFVVEFADVIVTHVMNPYVNSASTNGDGNKGGWQYSEMRSFVNNDLYNALPSELRNAIINTTVVSGHGSSDSSNFTTTDKLYLLSFVEVLGSNHSNDTLKDTNTRQLDYYFSIGASTSNRSGIIKYMSGSDRAWWFRTPASYVNYYFMAVVANGNTGFNNSDTLYGVSPAFRLG